MVAAPTWSRTHRTFLSIDDLGEAEMRALLDTASNCASLPQKQEGFSVGIFLGQSSLRTRVGYCEAARRLGGTALVVEGLRQGIGASATESTEDTLRVLSGMVDVLVVRVPERLDAIVDCITVPLVNGGDADEHPTQALIDLFAIRQFCGPIEQLRIGVSGDLTMRAYRSFAKALRFTQPEELRIMAPPERTGDNAAIGDFLGPRMTYAQPGTFEGLDVLYLPGLPARKGGHEMNAEQRSEFALTTDNASRLPSYAHVFSPMPVIDELAPQMRKDPRVRIFQQSNCGIAVRMAVLQFALQLR